MAVDVADPAERAQPAQPVGPAEHWVVRDLRKMAAASCAGLVAGIVVNAVGGRLAMMLLARLNPDATGRISDDGFAMGRFDLAATLNLVLVGTAIGVLGGLLFLAVRQLRFGPAWFQTASMTIGPAVVVGAMLVHTGGVDFRILQPVWLAIALFVVLPGLYALMVSRLADRWLREGSWFLTGSRRRLLSLAPLALVIPALPIVGVGVLGRVLYQTLRPLRTEGSRRVLHLVARTGFVGVFALGLVDLVADAAALL